MAVPGGGEAMVNELYNCTMMVQKNIMFYQRREIIGWKFPLVHIVF